MPSLLFADRDGNITDFPDLSMAGMANRHYRQPELEDLIPLPEGSEILFFPDDSLLAVILRRVSLFCLTTTHLTRVKAFRLWLHLWPQPIQHY